MTAGYRPEDHDWLQDAWAEQNAADAASKDFFAGFDQQSFKIQPVASIDLEAIAWAYRKLLAYGVGNVSMDNALMLDRLNLMLLRT